MKLPLLAFALAFFSGCQERPAPSPIKVPIQPYQRFVPVPAPQAQMTGVPWTGFFALDTQIGRLCLTVTPAHVSDKFVTIPMCEEDLRLFPTPGETAR